MYINLFLQDIYVYLHLKQIFTHRMKKIVNEQLHISDSNPIKARAYDYKSFTYPWHFHGEYEILYVEKGYGQCIIGDSIIDYSDETLLLFGSALPHCMQTPAEFMQNEKLRVNGTIIQFEKDFMQYSFTHYVQFMGINTLLNESNRGVRISIKNKPEISSLLKQIPESEGMEQIILFLRLLQSLSMIKKRDFAASPNYNPVPAEFKNKKIEKVVSYINKKYTDNISLDEISSYAAMNPSAFCRYFKDNTGKTLKQYITDMRIGYACKLLSDDRLNISEISIECGFESAVHFNRCFRAVTGVTPTEYRRKIHDL